MKKKPGSHPLTPLCGLIILLALALSGPGLYAGHGQGLTFSEPEGHERIQLNNTSARVSAYQRDGKIKRLFGEAFSHGETALESSETFIQANAGLLGVGPDDLVGTGLQPVMYDIDTGDYKFTAVNYTQSKGGIPVYGTRLILLVRNEAWYPLVLASVDLRDLGHFNPILQPEGLNPDLGIMDSQNIYPDLVRFTEPELVIWAGMEGAAADPVLAYTFVGENDDSDQGGKPEKFRFVADAGTGRILHEENLIIFTDVAGNVQGKATQGYAAEQCGQEVAVPMPYARVTIGDTIAYADENGDFIIPNSGTTPVIVQSLLRGEWFRTTNRSGSNAVLNLMAMPPGPVNFVHNTSNKDEFYRAQVNGYLQANTVRDYVLTYNPDYPGLQQNAFPVNVNDTTGYCPGNAWYDYSSINFCASGGGYPNTAFTTVLYHEYGHHLVAMAGSGQDEYGEGMGDTMGILISDDPNLAYGFFGDCDVFMRTGDNDLQYPCSGEIHYCGQLISGCVWSTRNALFAANPLTYRRIISTLAINAMLVHTGSSIDPAITIDYLVLDDDNGNIYDGTPHYDEIDAGFSAHNMDAPDLAFVTFTFPDGLPDLIDPDGGTSVRVLVDAMTQEPQPDTGVLYFNDGSGWQQAAMIQNAPNDYEAVFPAIDCASLVSYYFSADSTLGNTQFWPMDAPDVTFTTISAYGTEETLSDNFETDLGWTVEDSVGLGSGTWERGTPAGGGDRGDPPTDYDGSGQCYLTGNSSGDSDIDNGTTWLISPSMDLSTATEAVVNFALWYTNDYGNDPNNDLFNVYLSDNGGADWTLVQTIGPESLENWNEYSFMVGDHVTLSDQVKVRFEASDLNEGSVVEAAVDDFSVMEILCNPQNSDPVLSGGTVSPASGYYGTQFEYTVDYFDGDDDVPSVIRVYIDGNGFDMTLASGTAHNGSYRYRTRDVAQDESHNYYFHAEDGQGGSGRYPASDTLSGPTSLHPDLSVAGTPVAGGTMTVDVWGAVDAMWAAAWSSQSGPFYISATGLTFDIGPGDVHFAKKLAANPVHLDEFGFGTKDFQLPGGAGSGMKYIQGATKMNAFWAKTNVDTFVIP